MNQNISGCCSKNNKNNVIFINTNKSLGRQNFTLAHELYHLHFEDNNEFIICGSNNFNNENERKAYEFAANFLMPYDALNKYKQDHNIKKWKLIDIIKCEQYFKVSHSAMLTRLKNIHWITYSESKKFKNEIINNAKKFGLDTSLYQASSNNQKYHAAGKLINLTEKMFKMNKISRGLKKEILLKNYG